jgi:hypothetical protein
MSLVLFVMALVGCRADEMAIDVTADSQGVRFIFGYIVQPSQAVKVSTLIVQELPSRAIVWEFDAVSHDKTDDNGMGGHDARKENKTVTFVSLHSVSFGSIPAGFEQVTPPEQHKVYLQDGIKYRVIALAERGSGMSEFTLKGECQKLSFTTFSKDLPEFNQLKDC